MKTNKTAETESSGLPAQALASDKAMSLRIKINLIFSLLTLLVFSILIAVEVNATRNSVREEMEASGRIASQLLGRISSFYAAEDTPELVAFLRATGRVRANDIQLYDEAGTLLYDSPPSVYKLGRDAPHWYAALVSPAIKTRIIPLNGSHLAVTTNPTRAVLDGWDNLRDILIAQATLFILADLLIFWLMGRWLAPLEKIQQGLREIEQGDHHVRLPALPGKEAGEMGRAFNRMAQAVEENIQVKQTSAEAQARLVSQREFTQVLHARIEEERAALARELHDELGQSLTAMRTISKSIMQHPDVQGGTIKRSAQMLFDTAGMTSDAMHRMIPRLRPIQLEGMGLIDALRDLLTGSQVTHATLKIELNVEGTIPALEAGLELSAYRIVQEALTNIVRHAQASRAQIALSMQDNCLCLSISDNGTGAVSLKRDGHYGVRGMQERAESLGGSIAFLASAEGGLEVRVLLPIHESAV